MKCSGADIAQHWATQVAVVVVGISLGAVCAHFLHKSGAWGSLSHFFGKTVPHGTNCAARKIIAFYSHHTGSRVLTTLVTAACVTTSLGLAILSMRDPKRIEEENKRSKARQHGNTGIN